MKIWRIEIQNPKTYIIWETKVFVDKEEANKFIDEMKDLDVNILISTYRAHIDKVILRD